MTVFDIWVVFFFVWCAGFSPYNPNNYTVRGGGYGVRGGPAGIGGGGGGGGVMKGVGGSSSNAFFESGLKKMEQFFNSQIKNSVNYGREGRERKQYVDEE